MQAIDLSIPIYLNQPVVFDLLAVIDDGFSHLSTIKTSSSELDASKSNIGGSIGLSNVFALLGVSFSGGYEKEKEAKDQIEKSQEKVHTPTSLFAKLRLKLQELELVRNIDEARTINNVSSGEFVEFKALLKKNPVIEALEGMKQLYELSVSFQEQPNYLRNEKDKHRQIRNSEKSKIIQQFDSLLAGLKQENSIELVAELCNLPEVKAVITSRTDFFSQGGIAETIDGEFYVFGKVIRTVKTSQEDPINLLRKTTFGKLDPKIWEGLSSAFSEMRFHKLNSSEIITEIKSPSLLVLPIAIFT